MNSVIAQITKHTYECSDEQIKFYKQEGYVVLKDIFTPEMARTIKKDIDGVMKVIGLGQTKLRQTQQYLRGSSLDAYINSLFMQKIASQLMEGEATLYLPFSAVKSSGGGGKFHFHQDNNYTTFIGSGINLWSSFIPTNRKNGGLQILPKSHLNGNIEAENAGDGDHHLKLKAEPDEFITMELNLGDIVAFNRLTVHGSGPNLTNINRVAYAVQFHRFDTTTLENGKPRLLKTHPRWTDIHGAFEIVKDENIGRDGH